MTTRYDEHAAHLIHANEGADLIDALEDGRAIPELLRKIERHVPFEMASVLLYRRGSAPLRVYDDFARQGHEAGLRNYTAHSYVINPCYRAYLRGPVNGVHRIEDFPIDPAAGIGQALPVRTAPDEAIGFLTEGWPRNRDEVLLLGDMPGGRAVELSLLRDRAGHRFSDAELEQLRRLLPLAQAVVRAHCSRELAAADAVTANLHDNSPPPLFQLLSAREQQVVNLILLGHSSLAIGLHLKLALATVKTHRRNIYAKLGISTQCELLSLYLRQTFARQAAIP